MNSFGWKISKPNFSWTKLVINKKRDKRLNGIYKSLLANSGVVIFDNFAEFVNLNSIKVGNKFNTI